MDSTEACERRKRFVSALSSRKRPSSKCSVSIYGEPNWLASYRAKKMTRRAFSVYRSNMFPLKSCLRRRHLSTPMATFVLFHLPGALGSRKTTPLGGYKFIQSYIDPATVTTHPFGVNRSYGACAQTSTADTSSILPWANRRTRSQRLARGILWVTRIEVRPWLACRLSNRLNRASAVWLSRSPVGSSASKSLGLVISARAMDTRCCSPPESSPARWVDRSASPTSPSQ